MVALDLRQAIEEARKSVVGQYLASFGPVTINDITR